MTKKYILRFNSRNSESVYSFKVLCDGSKKIETRAATKKYRKIAVGDILVFVCGKQKLEKKVKRIKVFKSIAALLKVYRVKDIMPDRSSRKELEKAYFSYTGYREKIKKFGLIAFNI